MTRLTKGLSYAAGQGRTRIHDRGSGPAGGLPSTDLRMRERLELVTPTRTDTNLWLYSDSDITKLQQIQRLTQELGVNSGVGVILDLLGKLQTMRERWSRSPQSARDAAEDTDAPQPAPGGRARGRHRASP